MTRVLVLLLKVLLVAGEALAQSPVLNTAPKGSTSSGQPTSSNVDANTQALDVFIKGGARTGGASATDNSTFNGDSSSVNPMGALFDNTPPAITDGNIGPGHGQLAPAAHQLRDGLRRGGGRYHGHRIPERAERDRFRDHGRHQR